MQTGGKGEFKDLSSDAQTYFRMIKHFEFLVSLVVTMNVFDHTLALTVQLQQRKMDIADSLKHINLLKSTMAKLQAEVDEYHNLYYDQALELAKKLKMRGKIPRICETQIHRDNYPVSRARDLHRVKLTIPLLDHIIEELEHRFPSEMDFYNGFCIIPRNFLHCVQVNWKSEFMKFMEAYKDVMPNYRTIHAELNLWETSWKKGFENVEYDNIADTLKNCNALAFPNIFAAQKILAVVPVTTCECERSISALRRMKTWLRNRMTNERLT